MTKTYTKKRLFIDNFLATQNRDNNEYDLELQTPKTCFNAKSDLGALVCGNGLSRLKLPCSQTITQEITLDKIDGITFKKLWEYRYYSDQNERYEYLLIALGSDNNVYFKGLFNIRTVPYQLSETAFSSTPVAISFMLDGKDVVGFSSPTDDLLLWNCDISPYVITTTPKFVSICLHKQRLFVIDSASDNLVRFSSNTDPTSWTETDDAGSGGKIEMNDYKGQLKSLVSFGDYVVVFRDFGISKITSYSSDSVYYASNVYSSSRKLYCNTACVCENKLYFLQEDGLYYFDGTEVKKVDLKISKMLAQSSQSSANTCFYNGKLFIACNLDFDDDEQVGCEETDHANNCLVEFNPESAEYNITRGVDICSMLGINDLFVNKLIVLQAGNPYFWQLSDDGAVDGTALEKVWQSGKITLDSYSSSKILKQINLKCLCSCTLTVQSDKRTKEFVLSPSAKRRRLVCNIAGSEFCLKITSADSALDISNVEMIFSVED
jgi:hypothetical protein